MRRLRHVFFFLIKDWDDKAKGEMESTVCSGPSAGPPVVLCLSCVSAPWGHCPANLGEIPLISQEKHGVTR